ncbi:MAG: chemotaxis protein CheB [Methanosarcina sp.]
MVSALGEKAEEITLTAFEYGAVDVIQKPEGILSQSMPEITEEICRKVRAAAKVNLENLECMRNRELEKTEINEKKERQEGDTVEEGTVLVAPGNYHMEIVQKIVDYCKKEVVHLSCGPKELGSRPSVNTLFRSIAPIYGPKIISLILTGVNCNGVDGAEEIKNYLISKG